MTPMCTNLKIACANCETLYKTCVSEAGAEVSISRCVFFVSPKQRVFHWFFKGFQSVCVRVWCIFEIIADSEIVFFGTSGSGFIVSDSVSGPMCANVKIASRKRETLYKTCVPEAGGKFYISRCVFFII